MKNENAIKLAINHFSPSLNPTRRNEIRNNKGKKERINVENLKHNVTIIQS